MISDRINGLLDMLNQYHHTKDEALYRATAARLDKVLDTYVEELETSVDYLARRTPETLMRKLIKWFRY